MFLKERHLMLNERKTRIVHIDEGFSYLSRFYKRDQGILRCYPSNEAVTNFITDLHETITKPNIKWSQRALIEKLNQKLNGWATYHRVSDAERVFRYVDLAVDGFLLELLQQYYPHISTKSLIEKFWYGNEGEKRYFSLINNKALRVIRLEDVILTSQPKLNTIFNPYIHYEYFARRADSASMFRVVGNYKAIWERQKGRCYICDRPISRQQERQLMQIDLKEKPVSSNLAYVHSECLESRFFCFHTFHNSDEVNVLEIAQKIVNKELPSLSKDARKRLEDYFSSQTRERIVLSIKKIENIIGIELPEIAYSLGDYWLVQGKKCISTCWERHEYIATRFEKRRQRVIFMKKSSIKNRQIRIPEKLKMSNLPEELIYEAEAHFKYLIKKYGL